MVGKLVVVLNREGKLRGQSTLGQLKSLVILALLKVLKIDVLNLWAEHSKYHIIRKLSIIFISIIALSFSACSPRYYTPDAHSVPLITDKGEANLNLSGNGNRVEFQGAYGFSDKIAIKADGGLFWQKDNNDGNGGSGEFVEVGLGYFKQIKNHWVFETYGIVGFGSMENHLPSTVDQYPLTKGDISANILRYGIQPNFGFKSKYFTAAVSSRFVNLTYDNIKGDLIYNNVEQVDYLNKNSSNFLIEPAVTIMLGIENFKLQLQYGYSMNLSNSSFRQRNNFLTVGLNVRIQ